LKEPRQGRVSKTREWMGKGGHGFDLQTTRRRPDPTTPRKNRKHRDYPLGGKGLAQPI